MGAVAQVSVPDAKIVGAYVGLASWPRDSSWAGYDLVHIQSIVY